MPTSGSKKRMSKKTSKATKVLSAKEKKEAKELGIALSKSKKFRRRK